jgi:hypothetical protein
MYCIIVMLELLGVVLYMIFFCFITSEVMRKHVCGVSSG